MEPRGKLMGRFGSVQHFVTAFISSRFFKTNTGICIVSVYDPDFRNILIKTAKVLLEELATILRSSNGIAKTKQTKQDSRLRRQRIASNLDLLVFTCSQCPREKRRLIRIKEYLLRDT